MRFGWEVTVAVVTMEMRATHVENFSWSFDHIHFLIALRPEQYIRNALFLFEAICFVLCKNKVECVCL